MNKNGDCFVASVAYGTPLAKEVDHLRKYRDQYLLQSCLGRILVNIYYKVGPFIASIVNRSSTLKFVTRQILSPLVHYAKMRTQSEQRHTKSRC